MSGNALAGTSSGNVVGLAVTFNNQILKKSTTKDPIAEETEIVHGGRYEAMFDSKKWFLTEPQRHGEEGRHPSNHSWKALFGVSVPL